MARLVFMYGYTNILPGSDINSIEFCLSFCLFLPLYVHGQEGEGDHHVLHLLLLHIVYAQLPLSTISTQSLQRR